jgi:flagellar basal-body rod protein FlgC
MSDPLSVAMEVSGAGLEAQTQRMRIISQNIANATVTGQTPGSDPYSRKTISFSEALNRATGVTSIEVSNYGVDKSPFTLKYEPGHRAADESGMVKYSNVNTLMEMADMRESVRYYQANVETTKQVRSMITMTIDMMRR